MNEHPTDLIGAYALGDVDAGTAAAVREHLAGCEACRAEYNEARAVLDLLPHALDPVKPHERVLAGILTRIEPAATAPRRTRFPASAAIAAALVLALGGDVVLGALLFARHERTVAFDTATPKPLQTPVAPQVPKASREPAAPMAATPQSAPVATSTPHPATAASAPAVRPVPVGTFAPRVTRATPRPAGTADAAAQTRLARERDAAIDTLRIRSTQDAGRIAQLEHRLATQSGGGPREAAVLAALQNGNVYAIKGTVDGESWHATVLQPSPAANALLLTFAPSAPAGQDYRVWVLRNRHTYDAGSIAPHTSTTLEMPMPLQVGDVVAFSREPESTGNLPTQPFLMELPISN